MCGGRRRKWGEDVADAEVGVSEAKDGAVDKIEEREEEEEQEG